MFFGKSVTNHKMTTRLPNTFVALLALLVVAALAALGTAQFPTSAHAKPDSKPADETTPAAPASAQDHLQQAITRLESYSWVSAKLQLSLNMLDEQLTGVGYYRQGPALRMRMELKTRLNERDQPAIFEQVCDGRILLDHRQVLASRSLERVDVERVCRELQRHGESQFSTECNFPGLGGLPQLLRAIHEAFEFDTVRQTTSTNGVKLLVLQGHWTGKLLQTLLPKQAVQIAKGRAADLEDLPLYAPDQVLLVLDAESRFPYRVEFQRTAAAGSEAAGPTGVTTLMSLELSDVQLNAPLAEEIFAYQPAPGLKPVDKTADYLKALEEFE